MGAIRLLAGTTHGSVAARQGYDPQDSAVLTMKELEKCLTLEIVGKYHQTVHRSLLRPPIAVWRDWEDKIPFELPTDRWPSGYRSFHPRRGPYTGTESICFISATGLTRYAAMWGGR
jgi:hypothetical protein